ncbi:MAG: Oligopeptide transport system permease protein OppC [Anaerolineales bacterium]|nr:Oligopeptide transport system permease protein OppC [Anaerolineales bacterium]
MNQTDLTELTAAGALEEEQHESYFQLVWTRFRKSKPAIVGGLMIIGLVILAVFSDFFSPTDPLQLDMPASFTPPQRIHFIDDAGTLHLRPFTYNQVVELDPTTYAPQWTEDKSRRYPLKFLVRSWEWKLLGVIPTQWHLFGAEEGGTVYLLGTDKFGRDLWSRACRAGRISLTLSLFATLISVGVGSVMGVVSGYYGGWIDTVLQRFIEFVQSFPQLPLWMALAAVIPPTWNSFRIFVIMSFIFALLGWTVLAREVRGKVMSFRETDFILAAKEMGASDLRIIFRHLYPNSLSHIIVILTLTIPQIILAEAFLSFLGIGIQEPLTSWGLLMHDAQNLQTLGTHPWIMSPVIFIIVAVLGFNFLGDGLRDAADPYSIVR